MFNMKYRMRFYIFIIACAIVFLCALWLRIYYMNKKVDLHVDEGLSIVLAEYNKYGWSKYYDEDKVWSANELKKAILWNDASFNGAISDVAKLWNNNRDSPHTNLYYSLLRLWHIGFDSVDIDSIIMRGISLNLIFFAFSFLFAALLGYELFCTQINRILAPSMVGGGSLYTIPYNKFY